jgi:FtsP/CotA-like multicopper oxidase with cupredoxin domain
MSGVQRAGLVLAALAVLLIAFLIARGGGNDDNGGSQSAQTTTTTTTTQSSTAQGGGQTQTQTQTQPAQPPAHTIRVVDGEPQGGIQTISFVKGDQVRLKVVSDTADEIHVHGYDRMKDVSKGGTVTFTFPASIEGRFEIELENAGTQIATLEVTPS